MAKLQSQFQHVRDGFRRLTCSDIQRPDFPRTEEAGSSNLLRSTQTFPQVEGHFPGSSPGLHSDEVRRGIR